MVQQDTVWIRSESFLIHNTALRNPEPQRTEEQGKKKCHTTIACLHEILEESSEEEGEKRTSQIQALVPVVITVIQLTAS
jgi:hypothetical protein